MTPWLKMKSPKPGPAMPPTVDHRELMVALGEQQRFGLETPAGRYLWINSPPEELDQWGQPLPLCAMDQDQLDRLVAILVAPMERGKALLESGQLADDEVVPIMAVYPDIYSILVEKARQDMILNPPPYPAWSENVLSVLFQRPASAVYAPPKPSPQPETNRAIKPPEGTVADRRELAVRGR